MCNCVSPQRAIRFGNGDDQALPGAARSSSMATRFGGGLSRFGEGLSKFSAGVLPIINLGLLGYGFYNQAKNNRENERHRKMIEGNQI